MLYRILVGVVLVLALSLAGGTLYAFFRGRPTGGDAYIEESLPPSASFPLKNNAAYEHLFAGIGRLRVSTAAPESATVIVSIAFPYIPQDNAFSEELAARILDFRRITAEYFMLFSVEELRRQNEADIKTELLRRYNSLLRLGRIEQLFFNDYMIIE